MNKNEGDQPNADQPKADQPLSKPPTDPLAQQNLSGSSRRALLAGLLSPG